MKKAKITKILEDPDGTIKLQITLYDGLCIETVLLIDKEGRKSRYRLTALCLQSGICSHDAIGTCVGFTGGWSNAVGKEQVTI